MPDQHTYIVVLVTAKDEQEAQAIAQALLKDKLVACVNILPGVKSFFWWDGKIDKAEEVMLVLKTRKALFKEVEVKVRSVHSYQTPEIIAIPIIAGNDDYLNWINDATHH